MSKALRIAGIAIAALLAAAAVTAAVTWRFGADIVKAVAAQALLEGKQRHLRIDGPLELSLSSWPVLVVRAGKVSLSERESEREFLAVDSARIAVAAPPLLERRLIVDAIEIDGLRAAIVRRKDGTFNFDDLLSKDDAPMPRFDIAGLRLSGGRLDLRDERGGRSAVLSGLSLHTGRLANAAEGPLALAVKAAAGDAEAGMKIDAHYRFDLDGKALALPKFDGALDLASPRLPMKRLRLPLAGSLRVDWGRRNADLRLSTQFDESRIAAKLSLARFSPPDLGLDLEVDRFNADRYFRPAAQDPAGTPAERKLDLAALRPLNLHGTVRVGQLQVAGVMATDVKLRIGEANGL